MKQPPNFELSTDYADLYFEDGILHTYFRKDQEEDLEVIKNHINQVRATFGDRLPVPNLTFSDNIKPIPKEIWDYFASDDFENMVTASAVVTKRYGKGNWKYVFEI